MTTQSEVVGLLGVTTTAAQMQRTLQQKTRELWAGAVYLLVWSVLWLAVIVGVLAPLGAVFAESAR
jgi:hypothetical protein